MDRTKDPRLLGAVAVLALALFGFTPGNCAGEDPEDRDEQSQREPDRDPACSDVLCEMYCENGFARDANGCEICQCAVSGCEGLDEAACEAAPGCHPVYAESDVGCACPECDPDDPNCAPCDCPPMEREYAGCEADRPDGSCSSDADCRAGEICWYADGSSCTCPDNADCDCAERGPGKCGPPEPNGCDLDCPEGEQCMEICGPVDEDCDPATGVDCGEVRCEVQCVPVIGECDSDEDCPDGSCWNGICGAGRCESDEDCPDGECINGVCGPEQCDSDDDCPGGSCEPYYTCMAIGCPPSGSTCVYPTGCGDGSELHCDSLPPECAEGQVAAVVDNCWACVDDSCLGDECGDARYDAAGQCIGADGTVKPAECCANQR